MHPLRSLRLAHDLSLRDLAGKTGVPASTISRIENGWSHGANRIVRLASGLGVETDSLARVIALCESRGRQQ